MTIVGKGNLDGAGEKDDLAEDLHLDEVLEEEERNWFGCLKKTRRESCVEEEAVGMRARRLLLL